MEINGDETTFREYAGPGGYRYCPYCREKLVISKFEGIPRPACPVCGFIHYNNPVPAAGGIIVRDRRILFVKRKYEPRAGLWSLPAGFIEHAESPEQCAVRELQEETGLTGEIKDLVGVYAAGDDPRSRVVLIIYYMEILGGRERPGDDACEIAYFTQGNFPPFAWNSHHRALGDFFARYAGSAA